MVSDSIYSLLTLGAMVPSQLTVALSVTSSGTCASTAGQQIVASAPFPASASSVCPSLIKGIVALKESQIASKYIPKTCGAIGQVSAAISPW